MPSKRHLERENEELKAEVRDTRELLKFSAESVGLGVLALAEARPPSEEDMKTLAEEFPLWSIKCETVGGGFDSKERKIVKHFTRHLSDLNPELESDRETYLRFFDGEYFDDGIREAFRLASTDTDLGWVSGNGTKTTRGGWITIGIEGETSLTKLDLIRVKAAEQYLVREGVVAEAVAA